MSPEEIEKLVERLAAHRTIGSAPREQLEWLVEHGTLRQYEPGVVLARISEPMRELAVVLSGHLVIRVDRGGVPRKVLEWRGGDVSGVLPYSRMRTPPGTTTAEEASEMLLVDRDCFPDMITRCHELTAILVHVMLDRARRFTTSDFQLEKMISLGRLSAGLAHELNNPASAVARTARELGGRVFEMEAAALALGSMRLTAEQLREIGRVRALCHTPSTRKALGPLERADREDEVAGWLERHGLKSVTADELTETALEVKDLDGLLRVLGPEAIEFALKSIGACHRTRALASEVEIAATRIHSLVAAIKGFTYMDQTRVPKSVAIGRGLSDTLAVLGAKARAKSVTVSLQVPEDLPTVEGLGGELNQVWANLIDNAIDAVSEAGHVEVSAERLQEKVVVRVVDDGPGVTEEQLERIFEPFYTTKPVGSGTGLGLDIARRLISQHDGQIEVDSRPGRTEFRVILPTS